MAKFDVRFSASLTPVRKSRAVSLPTSEMIAYDYFIKNSLAYSRTLDNKFSYSEVTDAVDPLHTNEFNDREQKKLWDKLGKICKRFEDFMRFGGQARLEVVSGWFDGLSEEAVAVVIGIAALKYERNEVRRDRFEQLIGELLKDHRVEVDRRYPGFCNDFFRAWKVDESLPVRERRLHHQLINKFFQEIAIFWVREVDCPAVKDFGKAKEKLNWLELSTLDRQVMNYFRSNPLDNGKDYRLPISYFSESNSLKFDVLYLNGDDYNAIPQGRDNRIWWTGAGLVCGVPVFKKDRRKTPKVTSSFMNEKGVFGISPGFDNYSKALKAENVLLSTVVPVDLDFHKSNQGALKLLRDEKWCKLWVDTALKLFEADFDLDAYIDLVLCRVDGDFSVFVANRHRIGKMLAQMRQKYCERGRMPVPTAVQMTGRGFQVYYRVNEVLHKKVKKGKFEATAGLKFWKLAQKRALDFWSDVASIIPLTFGSNEKVQGKFAGYGLPNSWIDGAGVNTDGSSMLGGRVCHSRSLVADFVDAVLRDESLDEAFDSKRYERETVCEEFRLKALTFDEDRCQFLSGDGAVASPASKLKFPGQMNFKNQGAVSHFVFFNEGLLSVREIAGLVSGEDRGGGSWSGSRAERVVDVDGLLSLGFSRDVFERDVDAVVAERAARSMHTFKFTIQNLDMLVQKFNRLYSRSAGMFLVSGSESFEYPRAFWSKVNEFGLEDINPTAKVRYDEAERVVWIDNFIGDYSVKFVYTQEQDIRTESSFVFDQINGTNRWGRLFHFFNFDDYKGSSDGSVKSIIDPVIKASSYGKVGYNSEYSSYRIKDIVKMLEKGRRYLCFNMIIAECINGHDMGEDETIAFCKQIDLDAGTGWFDESGSEREARASYRYWIKERSDNIERGYSGLRIKNKYILSKIDVSECEALNNHLRVLLKSGWSITHEKRLDKRIEKQVKTKRVLDTAMDMAMNDAFSMRGVHDSHKGDFSYATVCRKINQITQADSIAEMLAVYAQLTGAVFSRDVRRSGSGYTRKLQGSGSERLKDLQVSLLELANQEGATQVCVLDESEQDSRTEVERLIDELFTDEDWGIVAAPNA